MLMNWIKAVSVNNWQGVTVGGPEGRVIRLDIAGLGLNGRIPSDFGHLDRLVSLSLQRNRLSGPIPPELGDLTSLEHLNLNYNSLTGGIPPELARLENLKDLWLKGNRLTGPLSAALGELDPSILHLSGNDFDAVSPELAAVADHDLANARLCRPLPSTSPALHGAAGGEGRAGRQCVAQQACGGSHRPVARRDHRAGGSHRHPGLAGHEPHWTTPRANWAN